MAKDKLYHLVAGFIIALIFGLINPLLGLVTATIIGAAKEVVYDRLLKKGCFEILDFIATFIGGLIGMILILLFNCKS